ncbi:MAG: choice-of-anchor Q domain-containing protein [Candidatus Promineifilaceae bacterium]
MTLARNVAGYHGGGISGSGAVARNTLIANNRAEWANDSYHNCTHEINNWGHNIQFVDAQTASQCGDTIWTRDPLLGSLGLHNGQTQSIALLAGSAAIDAGNPTTCKTYDQRHIARTYGTACDIGAFEAVDPVAPTATSPSETNTPVPTATSATATPTPEITPTQQNTPTATPTDTGGTATPTPSPTPSSTPVSGTGSTVGDGTAASCTEAAFAQALALGGVVRFDCGSQPVTIPLTQRHMMLIDTTIDGGNLITLDGQHATALLGSEERLSIELHNLTLINGHSHEEGAGINVGYWNAFSVHNVTFSHHTSLADHKVCDGGGAIFIGGGGVTTIENSSFYDNAAMNGGAINNLRTKLTILDSVFEGNEALHSAEFNTLGDCGGGGALYFDGTRKPEDGGADLVILRNLQFIDNLTNNVGGAIFLAVRTNERVLIEDVLFKGNRAIQGPATFDTSKGGALWIGQGVGGQTGYQIDLNRVSFIDNHSEFQGGALWTRSPAKLTNVTFFGNTAIDHRITDPDNWRAGIGGAITAADQAVVSLQHTSVVSNTAGFVGGGINGDNFILMNSLIANNAGLWWRGLQQNCTQHPQNWGGNLQYLLNQPENKLLWNSNCGDSIVVADPKVGTPVQFSDVGITIPLQADSGAIDIGAASKCLSVDQRGVPRPSGGACDSGAYEYSTARSKERH